MVAGSWMNNDGLYIQYGTQKAVPTTAGDYLSYGEWRDIEFTVNLAGTAGTYVVANTTFLGTNIFLESVNLDVEVAAAGGTSLSIGTRRLDRTTDISTTNIVNASLTATLAQGASVTLTGGSSTAGSLVGTTITTSQLADGAAYLTYTTAGTFTAGTVKVRLRYRGIGNITQ